MKAKAFSKYWVLVVVLAMYGAEAAHANQCEDACETNLNGCYYTALWFYNACNQWCDPQENPGCEMECESMYDNDLMMCDMDYYSCISGCDNGGSGTSSCSEVCSDGSWSGIGCYPGQTAVCSCTGSPVLANPHCISP